MKKVITWFIGFNVFIVLFNYTVSASKDRQPLTLLPLIVLVIMIYFVSQALKLSGVKPTFKFIGQFIAVIFKPIHWLTLGLLDTPKGSRWAHWWEMVSLFKPSNIGFMLDGKSKKLSLKDSFNNVLISSPVGAGKTTVLCLPNIYEIANTNSSMVITDVKPSREDTGMGELYRMSSGYLTKKGFNIRVLNLMNPLQSLSFNPLASLNPEPFKAFSEVQAIANSAIEVAGASGSDPHWRDSAKKHSVTFINALRAMAEQNPRYKAVCNLSSLRHLLGQCAFYRNPRDTEIPDIDNFMLQAGLTNPTVSQDYLSAVAGNPNTVSGEISTAITALANLANPAIANLMGTSNFKFSELREQKTALFITVSVTDLEQGTFNFILSTFMNQLLNNLRHSLAFAQRPVFMLLDEVGQFKIENLSGFLGTAREYKVGVMGILQSISQLDNHYGLDRAKTIRENMLTQGCFGGTKGVTADYFSQEIGKTRFIAKQRGADFALHREDVVVSPSEITTTKNKYMFCTNANRYPMKFKVTPFYNHPRYKKYARIPPVPIPETTPPPAPIIDLEYFRPQVQETFEPEEFQEDQNLVTAEDE